MRLLTVALFAGLLATAAPAQTSVFPDFTGEQLLDSLRATYTPFRTLGYNLARDQLYQYEQDADGELCGVYTGYCVELTPGADPSTDAFDKGINAEHTWPQSFGAADEPARSDLHNLFPAKEDVNSARGNKPFGEIPDAQTTTWYRGAASQSAIPTADLDEWSEDRSGLFEPREDHKGNAARAVFYFYTIYPNAITSSGDAFFDGMLQDLLSWNDMDPADDEERARSAWIETRQRSENPFVLDGTLARRAFAPETVAAEDGPEGGLAVALYPNPSVGRVTIEADGARELRAEVVDLLGRRVRVVRAAPGADRLALDLGDVPAGVYVVRVVAGGATATRRVTVVR
ncbi:endonuclease [Rubrivirga marina]|uniref:Secretion system C-terminal sorting domain-containing protein n=1 Tax=Rubrivirga marina TaxID=1196024 RepID=A0A271J4E1_9BACT|nr:endonuclease [Rubrivirga marina]PAP78157.1 hypothetical protein BSZ37_17815 [Rubrivirga marina]